MTAVRNIYTNIHHDTMTAVRNIYTNIHHDTMTAVRNTYMDIRYDSGKKQTFVITTGLHVA